MLFVMRIIQGVGLGMLLALVPLYLTEVAPPQHRGFLTGSTQFATGIGYIVYVVSTNSNYRSKMLITEGQVLVGLSRLLPCDKP